MKSEELDRRITLQPLNPDSPKASDGSVIKDYTQNNIDVWAAYLAQSGREFYAAQKINSEVKALFKIRYRSGIDTTWRVKFGNRYFDVLFADDTRRRQDELFLACKEVV